MLPLLPGVYQFLDENDEVIYVGKAKKLRRRVASYFMEGKSKSAKVRVMVRRIEKIHHLVVATEGDALLLENNLIKRLQPRYNILLKDDKTYPWIVIRNEPFPRIESTRSMVKDGSKYFGPYASVVMQRNVLELIRGLYPLRSCSLNLAPEQIAKQKYSVCLDYHIGNCLGPCIGEQSQQEYDENIEQIAQTLSGNMGSTKAFLEKEMKKAAQAMRFELADRYKTRLELLDNYVSKSVIVSSSLTDIDVFSILKDIDVVYCNFVRIVGGAVVKSFTAQFDLGAEDDDKVIITRAIQQISEQISGPLAKEVIVPVLPEEELFEGVRFAVPKIGDKRRLLEFSEKNARIYRLERMKNLEIRDPARHTDRIMEAMQKELRMEVEPRYIECFDNSNLQGTNPVASCVVFRDGKPSRAEYRHYNIKTVEGPDDYASMREVVGRRYKRLIEDEAELPDLIVVDGGKGQLSAAVGVLEELGIYDKVVIVGLAERIEEVFYPNDPMPYNLDRTGEPLKVMIHIRDEAHRFGITFHRQKRSKEFIKSDLESISGIGKVSITNLLKKFKTISGVKKATHEQLSEVVGPARATAIKEFYKGK